MIIVGKSRRSQAGQNRGGITLVEIMVAIGLISVSLMLVLALIPAGIHSTQRAEDIQTATAWSRQLIETAPVPEQIPIPPAIAQTEHEERIGATSFHAVRNISVVAGEKFLYRIDVETSWGERTQPLKFSLTKYNPAGPE